MNIKRIIVSLSIVSLFMTGVLPVLAGEMPEIASIREYYSETLKRIKSGSLYHRELSLSYPVVPGTGPTASRVSIFYELSEGRDGAYEYRIIRVENYYQNALKVFYEEYLFDRKGELIFCYGRRGSGDIDRPDGIRWWYDERFYYRNENLIGAVSDKPHERLGDGDIQKGKERLKQAQEILEKYCTIRFPAPVIFSTE